MPAALVSIVGTTTKVRDSGGFRRRNPIAAAHAGHQQRRQPVHERDRQLARRAAPRRQERRAPSPTCRRRWPAPTARQRRSGNQSDRAEIKRQGRALPIRCAMSNGGIAPGRVLELRQSRVDQVEPDMGRSIVAACLRPPCAPAAPLRAPPRLRRTRPPSRCLRRRDGSGRASRSPSCRTCRSGPRAISARRRSWSRRIHASPSRPGNAGCRCCC